MNEHDLRDMLERRAADVRVSSDALDQIQAKIAGDATKSAVDGRRRYPTVIVAVAAVLVVALVTVGLVGRDDDPTSVEVGPAAGTGDPPAPGASVTLLDAVWPSADLDELRSMSSDALRTPDPWGAASAYLTERLGIGVPADQLSLVSGEASDAVVRPASDGLDLEITMKRVGTADDPIWYVVRTDSTVLAIRMASYDGERITGEVLSQVDGELTIEVEPADASDPVISMPIGVVQAREPASFDEPLPDEDGVVVRAIVRRGRTDIALAEAMIPSAAPGAAAPAAPDAVDDEAQVRGIWPWPRDGGDDPSPPTDPADVARAYVEARVTDLGTTTATDFMEGDSTSGEVTFRGDIETTVLLRRDGDRWYVEAAVNDIVDTEVRDDGTILVGTDAAGTLVHTYRTPHSSQELARLDVAAGDETELSAPPDDEVAAHQLVFELRDGTIALTEVRAVEARFTGSEVPDEAVDPQGGVDPREVARDYLRRRLGEEVEVRDFVGDDESGTVDWLGGGVQLGFHDGAWYVVGALGANVSIEDVAEEDGALRVDLFLGEAGALEVTAYDAEGGDCGMQTADVTGRGPKTIDFPVPCDVESVRAFFTTPDGETTFADVPS